MDLIRPAAKCALPVLMLLGLPLLGVYAAGLPIGRYLEFPPQTVYTQHAPFSGGVFAGYAVAVAAVAGFFLSGWLRARKGPAADHPPPAGRFPWWGWLGAAAGVASWIMAWSRFAWFAGWQVHTFTPLWLSFIVVINAFSCRRQGRCMMLHQTRFFLLLFPASAVFWWFFEYLNRFVQNWHYVNSEATALEYFCYGTLSFATVLPAVLSVREWLLSGPWIALAFGRSIPVRPARPKLLAGAVLAGSAAGLTAIGIYPDLLFSLLWVSPGLIVIALQTLNGERHLLSAIAGGDWSSAAASALAALFCGWFWEMWNYWSLAKWQYTIPYVDRFHLFEMPLLGYAGYLPFGLECAVIGGLLARLSATHLSER